MAATPGFYKRARGAQDAGATALFVDEVITECRVNSDEVQSRVAGLLPGAEPIHAINMQKQEQGHRPSRN